MVTVCIEPGDFCHFCGDLKPKQCVITSMPDFELPPAPDTGLRYVCDPVSICEDCVDRIRWALERHEDHFSEPDCEP